MNEMAPMRKEVPATVLRALYLSEIMAVANLTAQRVITVNYSI